MKGSRDRVRKILEHKIPDRIAIDFGSTEQTSISIGSYKNLREYYGLDTDNIKTLNLIEQIALVDDDILNIVKADLKPVIIKPPLNWKLEIKKEIRNGNEYSYFFDEWGTKMIMPKINGYYYDFDKMPLEGMELCEIKKYKFPDPTDSGRYFGLKEESRDLYEKTDFSLVGSALFGGGIFEQPARLRGFENFLMDIALNVKIADYLYSKVTDIYIESVKRFLEKVGEYIDVITYWDDIAHQTGYLISKEHYRKYVKPRQKQYFECIKKYSNAKIYYHGCGSMYDFIPDLIDIGVDILNPIQVNADKMTDLKKLKKEFGNEIIFWGGAVDSQRTLPFGTKKEVKEEVINRVNDLKENGGYVFSNIHNIQNGVPTENIVTMFETALKYGKY